MLLRVVVKRLFFFSLSQRLPADVEATLRLCVTSWVILSPPLVWFTIQLFYTNIKLKALCRSLLSNYVVPLQAALPFFFWIVYQDVYQVGRPQNTNTTCVSPWCVEDTCCFSTRPALGLIKRKTPRLDTYQHISTTLLPLILFIEGILQSPPTLLSLCKQDPK